MQQAKPIYPTAAQEASLDLNTWNTPETENVTPAPNGGGTSKPSGSGSVGLILAGGLGLAAVIGLVAVAMKKKR